MGSHNLRVIAHTSGLCISNPESCVEVAITQQQEIATVPETKLPFETTTTNSQDDGSFPQPSAPFMDDEEEVVEAMVLPDGWSPTTADIAILPVATVVSE